MELRVLGVVLFDDSQHNSKHEDHITLIILAHFNSGSPVPTISCVAVDSKPMQGEGETRAYFHSTQTPPDMNMP